MNRHDPFGEELELIEQICAASSAGERKKLISRLEQLPVRIYRSYSRWLLINNVHPFPCWGETGYDPTKSGVPRDIQLLWAMSYGTSDIYNGGFHQFFSNWTGILAPEMIEWCKRAGFEKTAGII